MKMLLVGIVASIAATAAQAADNGGGGPGGGGYDCSRCMLEYYPGFGDRSFWRCQNTEAGSGAGCEPTPTGCTFSGGCVSLPGIAKVGLIP